MRSRSTGASPDLHSLSSIAGSSVGTSSETRVIEHDEQMGTTRAITRGWTLAAFVGLAVRQPAAAQDLPDWVSALDYRADEVQQISIGAYGYPFVRLQVNDVELELPFDTGNMVGLSLAPAWLQRLSLPRIDEWRSRASDGTLRGTYGIHEAGRVVAFGMEARNERVFEFIHPDLPGLLGPQLLRKKRFTLDYRNRVLAITDRPLTAVLESAGELKLLPSSRREDLLLVWGEIHGRRVLMQIDTGKSRTTIDPELASSLELEESEDGVVVEGLLFGELEFAVPSAKLVVLRQIDPDLSEPILVGIGSDIINQVVMTVDRIGGRLLVGEAR